MQQMILKNIMEPIIDEKLEEKLKDYDCCKCEVCKMDMKALALNLMPAKYVVTHMGSLYAKLETVSVQHEADVLKAVIRSIETVSNNKRHSD